MRDDPTRATPRVQRSAACRCGRVEGSRVVDDRDPACFGPRAYVGVRRHDDRERRRRGGNDAIGEASTQGGALHGSELVGEARLAERERADRDGYPGSVHGHPT